MSKKRMTSIELKIYCYLKERGCICSRQNIAEHFDIAPTTVGAALKRIEEELPEGCLPEGLIQRVKGGFRAREIGDEFSDDEVQLLNDVICTSNLLSDDQAETLVQKIKNVLQVKYAKQVLRVERLAVRTDRSVDHLREISYAVCHKKFANFVYQKLSYKTIPLKIVMSRGQYFLIAALRSKEGRAPKVGSDIEILAFDIDEIVLQSGSIFGVATQWRESAEKSKNVQDKISALLASLQ